MTTVLENFVTVRKTPGDVLSPTEYRSIVELIRGILKNYDFSDLNQGYGALLAHVSNYSNPHHDDSTNLFGVIVQKTYAIYVNMVQFPISFADFQTKIVPSLNFIELFRRIVLNRYVYDQVKTLTGSVPYSALVTLSSDIVGGAQSGQYLITFGNNINSETDFIKLGWSGNTSPFPVIFNANSLSSITSVLPIIFATTSEAPYLTSNDQGSGYLVPMQLPSNDLTIKMTVKGTPSTATPVLTLRNAVDKIAAIINPDKTISVTLNNTTIVQTAAPVIDGRINLTITAQGSLTLETYQNGSDFTQIVNFTFTSPTMITGATIGIGYEDLVTSAFGLRSLTIYAGYVNVVPVVPDGMTALIDYDGSYLIDYDGSFLIDTL